MKIFPLKLNCKIGKFVVENFYTKFGIGKDELWLCMYV